MVNPRHRGSRGSTPRGRHGSGARGGRGGRGGRGAANAAFLRSTEHFGHRPNGFEQYSGSARPFSMFDEAKNTERHGTDWQNKTGLRHAPISFVSAGNMEPSELMKPLVRENQESDSSDDNDAAMEPEAADDDSPAGGGDSVLPEEFAAGLEKLDLQEGGQKTPDLGDTLDEPAYVVDLVGDPTIAPKNLPHAQIPARSPSPALSTSSSASERIVFVPRGKRAADPSGGTSPTNQPQASQQVSPELSRKPSSQVEMQSVKIETTIEIEMHEDNTSLPPINATFVGKSTDAGPSNDFLPFSGRAARGNKRRRPTRRRKQRQEEAEAVRDYVENITAQLEATASSSSQPHAVPMRDLGEGEGEWADSSTDEDDAASDEEAVEHLKSGMWNEFDLEDLDVLSTDSEGPRGAVDQVLGKRERPSGLQYLIKWNGQDTDDSSWVLAGSLDSTADDKIKKFEKELLLRGESSSSDGSDSDDEDAAQNTDDDLKLAQLLQEQEDLAIRGLSALEDEIMGLDSNFFPLGGAGGPPHRPRRRRRKPPVPKTFADAATGQFPSASGMADAYDGFDVMDWERPSIATAPGRGKKGKQAPVLDISDSELEAQIQSTWNRDREKKKTRKQQREALRAEGLLGKKARETGKPVLTAKYKEGMTMDQVCGEIREFMLRQHTSLPLPPMDKTARKIVHVLASKFYLKSRSVGAGASRFPTLYKTSRSTLFEHDPEGIDAVLRRQSTNFLRRMDVGSGPGRVRRINGGGGGGGGGGGKRHRDGAIVGAEAPELSDDNRGRRMLEKMGFRTGMTLGADGNKGISEPVRAIMKVSKAGLG